jgi:hypothetical protein
MSKPVPEEGGEGLSVLRVERSPAHVVYGGAHLFKSDTPQKLGKVALSSIYIYAPNFVEFALAMRLTGAEFLPYDTPSIDKLDKQLTKPAEKIKSENFAAWFAWKIYRKTIEKLETEPVEDFRIDFEDGYGFRSDEEEDSHAISASNALADAFLSGNITPFSGFRIKSLAPETFARAEKTLNLFLDNFLAKTNGVLPQNFVVTLPKVGDKKEIKHLRGLLKRIEKRYALSHNAIGIEIMVETPLAIIDKKGRVPLTDFVKAAKGRCRSVHFGAYDYTAAMGISAENQHLRHPACDFARQIMLTALSPLELRLSDSVTTNLPVPVHKGTELSQKEIRENAAAVHDGWREHFENVSNSMANGFYQSWDLHPNQLVARYAAVYSFFLSGAERQAQRLKGFVEKATQANLTGHVFDDAASARGLVNFFVRGIDCKAFTDDEVHELTGMSRSKLAGLF